MGFMVYGLRMGSMGVRRVAHSGGLQQSLHMLHHRTHLLVTPLTHSPDLETGAISPKISPCDLRNMYGLPILCMAQCKSVTD